MRRAAARLARPIARPIARPLLAAVLTAGALALLACGPASDAAPTAPAARAARRAPSATSTVTGTGTGPVTTQMAPATGAGSKCLDLTGRGTAAGTYVQLWECLGEPHQQWTWAAVDPQGAGELRVYAGTAGALCLDAEGGAGRNGDRLIAYYCNGHANQRWRPTAAGELVGINGRCVDLSGGATASTANGGTVMIWDCSGNVNQRWNVPAQSASAPPPPPDTTAPAPPPPAPAPTCPAPCLTIQPGQSIQAAVTANPAGTRFILGAGTHAQQKVTPKQGNQFWGVWVNGQRATVLDGQDVTDRAFSGDGAGSGVEIHGLTITRYKPALMTGTISADNGVAWTVEDNEISYGSGIGVRMGRRMRLLGNVIHHHQHNGVTGYQADSALVEGDTVTNNALAHYNVDTPDGDAAGMKVFRARGITTRNSVFRDNWGPGVWYDVDCTDALIEGNTITGNAHRGVMYEVSYNAVIRNNTIEGNGFGVAASWVSNAGIWVISSPNVEVYGNTVKNNRFGIVGVQTARGSGAYGEYLLQNLNVHDNATTQAQGYTGLDESVGSSAVFTSRNNRYVHNSYTLGTLAQPFLWNHAAMNESGWKGYGQDVTGTFTR